jgi:hypothetical protein
MNFFRKGHNVVPRTIETVYRGAWGVYRRIGVTFWEEV